MYNTSRPGGEGGVDVKKWLVDNKLTEIEKVFLEREVQVEELVDFETAELTDFAKDLGLDTLQRRRFVKAIQDMRKPKSGTSYGESGGPSTSSITGLSTTSSYGVTSTSSAFSSSTVSGSTSFGGEPSTTSRSGNVHVMVSPQEHKAMNKLHQVLDKCSYLLQQLEQSPSALKLSCADCDSEINDKFERIVAMVEDKRKQLTRGVDQLKQEKVGKLNEQLSSLVGYQQMIISSKRDYEVVMSNFQLDITSRKKSVVELVQRILQRKGINLIVATQPKMQLTFEIPVVDKFLNGLEIDDCDQPHPPIIAVAKITYNSVSIEWGMTHPSLVAKVDEFAIEIGKIKKVEEKKSKSKKSKKKGKGKKKGSDDSASDASESASESDDGSDDDSEKEDNKKSKKKKGGKDEEKAKDQDVLDDDGLNLGTEGDFTEEELADVKWTDVATIKAQRNKYRLESGQWQYDIRALKDSMIYAIRMRGKNKSGWGGYSSVAKATTKKMTIDSVILKSKEKAALLKFVSKKERKKKWKLLFRASKDGFASTQFHAKCDNKGTTVTVILSALGHVFGGYTSLPWQSGGGAYQQDANAFIFLLRSTNKMYKKPQKWGIKSGTNAVYHSGGYGPTFGGGFDFYICSGCDTTNSSYSSAGNSFSSPVDQTLLAGSYNFLVKEYEVYQIK